MSDPVVVACGGCGRGAVACWQTTGPTPALCCDACDHTIGDIAREQGALLVDGARVAMPSDAALTALLDSLPVEPLRDPGWVSRWVEP